MGRPLVLQFGGKDLTFDMMKVDRTKLYGTVEVEALDDKGRKCTLATLAGDGRTLLAPGGGAIALLSPEGHWLERAKLTPVDREGNKITPVQSTFSAPVPLAKKATIEEYFSCNIKAAYLLNCDSNDAAPLAAELRSGTIFTFPYSFRGGLEADAGFLLANPEGHVFLAVGQPTKIHFVGLEQAAVLTEEEGVEEGAEDDMDFGML